MILRNNITLLFCIATLLAYTQKNISFLGNLPYPEKINDVWGYTDIQGKEYALVGGTTGTSIVDVSTPSQPTQLFFIPGDTSIWRDIKTYKNYAYATNEESGGLLIVDLSDLPNNINYQFWKGDTLGLETAHNLFIDENGIAYIFGSNIKNQGALMLDLNSNDRFKPILVGIYDDRYVHDGFVRDNILWSSEINDGDFSVVDISNKQSPIVMARQQTSRSFTHQCWLSDDNNYLITNDEKGGAFIDIYDISDLNDIKRLDRYQSSPDDSVIPHNTFFKGNNYFFTSYYRDGVTLVDATKKDNLVEVGYYDTSPFSSDKGFEGCWGVYPYLPSGTILATDREEGLFVLAANYTRACYLEGTIIDTTTNAPLKDVRVEIIGTDYIKQSNFDGSYRIGVADSGSYDVRFSKPNCKTRIVSGINLQEAQVVQLDIETACDFPLNFSNINEKEKIITFPNPFTEKLNIQFESKELLKKIQILSMQGEIIKELEVNERTGIVAFVNHWSKGTYFIRFEFEQHTTTKIVQKIG